MSQHLKILTDNNFEQEVLKSSKPVLVDFWASWCQPCLALAPIIDEIAKEYGDKLVVGKINVDENPVVPSQYMIFSIPTLILFKNGEMKGKVVGFKPKAELTKLIDQLLK
jgi:thioredoxin 1